MGLKQDLINQLSLIMSEQEAQSEIDFALREHFGIHRTDEILNPDCINKYSAELFWIVKNRVDTRMPLQYILNKAQFWGDIYYVNDSVLIPRPETEILVQEVLKHAEKKDNPKILDIGTGSGCIAISIAKYLNSNNITAVDLYENALNVARKNAETLCPELSMRFLQSDVFENINEKFDIIVSNPPYIDETLKPDMSPEVMDYEPHSALFADNNGLFFYEKIVKESKNYLLENGVLAFEVGINQADKIENLMKKEGFCKVIIIPDFSSIDRVVLGMVN